MKYGKLPRHYGSFPLFFVKVKTKNLTNRTVCEDLLLLETTGIEPVTPCMSSPPVGVKHLLFL